MIILSTVPFNIVIWVPQNHFLTFKNTEVFYDFITIISFLFYPFKMA